MKKFVVLASVLIMGASLAQAQGRGARSGDARGWQGSATTQPTPNANVARGDQNNVQRPIRQRLRDPNKCQVNDGRAQRQRMRDPANCPRLGAAGRSNPLGAGWGRAYNGCGRARWAQANCPRCGCAGRQGGWRHGWGR